MSINLAKLLLRIISRSYNIILIGNCLQYFDEEINGLNDFDDLIKKGYKPNEFTRLQNVLLEVFLGLLIFPLYFIIFQLYIWVIFQ